MVLSCKDVCKDFGAEPVLQNITFSLEDKEKAALVGVNGAGKTTLVRILVGELAYDSGAVGMPPAEDFGYLPQNAAFESARTVAGELLSVFEPLFAMEEEMKTLEHGMAGLSGRELADCMARYDRLRAAYEQADGYSCRSRAKGVLRGLGFTDEEGERPMTTLSGGQKTRVALGKLLLRSPRLLILDEPTNHLDMEAIGWLEDYLRGYPGALLLISHDRYFLDKTVTKVIELENRKCRVFHGNYSAYTAQKEVLQKTLWKQYNDQQKTLRHEEEVIKTLKSFNREKSIKRAESREKQLAKIERLDRPEAAPEQMRLTLDPAIESGNDVLHVEKLAMGFGEKHLFDGVNIDIQKGERVALIGPNGVGKSTLFRILMGQLLPEDGYFKLGTNVRIGYYDQEQRFVNGSKTVLQEVADTYPTLTEGAIRNVLAAFVFTGDDVFQTIDTLSGGERGRLSLAKLMLSKANFLLLDEPTNHLDMFSKEILEDALNRYTGTVLYISHDRYFINKTAQRVLELLPHGVKEYLGNYDDYLARREVQTAETAAETAPTAQKLDWKRQKEQQAEERKKANALARAEKAIAETEAEISRLEALLMQEEVACDSGRAAEVYAEKTALDEKLLELYEQWEALQG